MATDVRGLQLTSLPTRFRDEVEDHLEDVGLLEAYDRMERGYGIEQDGEKGYTTTIEVRVTGMTCSACSSAVEGAVGFVDGVQSVSVSLLQNRARVVFDLSVAQVRSEFNLIFVPIMDFFREFCILLRPKISAFLRFDCFFL